MCGAFGETVTAGCVVAARHAHINALPLQRISDTLIVNRYNDLRRACQQRTLRNTYHHRNATDGA
jgi:hypothetical protein